MNRSPETTLFSAKGRVAGCVEIPDEHLRAGFVWRGSGRFVKDGGFQRLIEGFPSIDFPHPDLA